MPFPFVDDMRERVRPALIVSRPVGAGLIWALMITSAKNSAWNGDIALSDHAAAGLPVPCWIRTAKIAALEIAAIERVMGRLPAVMLVQVQDELRANLGW